MSAFPLDFPLLRAPWSTLRPDWLHGGRAEPCNPPSQLSVGGQRGVRRAQSTPEAGTRRQKAAPPAQPGCEALALPALSPRAVASLSASLVVSATGPAQLTAAFRPVRCPLLDPAALLRRRLAATLGRNWLGPVTAMVDVVRAT